MDRLKLYNVLKNKVQVKFRHHPSFHPELEDGENLTDDFPLIACPLATSTAVGNNTTLTFSAGDLKYTVA